jgi:hypothetical protein
MYFFLIVNSITTTTFLTDLLINNFILFPVFFITFFFLLVSFCLYFSLWNIFKIFFFTEALLLLCVIFITQYGNIYIYESTFHYFYCQLILAAAAAEAALFLGLFSHLYDQQFKNWVQRKKELDINKIYFFLVKNLNVNK